MPATVHADLTADGQRIILMAAGADEDVAYAAKLLETLTPLIKPTKPAGGMQLPVSWPAVVQLARTFGPYWQPGPHLRAWVAEQYAARALEPAGDLAVTPPEGLTPRPYQVAGALAISTLGSMLILDEPRTGKTVTTVLGLRELATRVDVGPVLVVCPAAVVDPWVEHFRAWVPEWRAVAWRGPKRTAYALTAEVYVTSYDTARLDVGPKRPLTTLAPRTLVLDECHKIKNNQAKQSQAVRKLAAKADQTIALSGTPITHHPADLWPTLDCLAPGAWPSRERWVHRYCLTVRGDYQEQILGLNPGTEDEFRLTLLGQQRRVTRADVAPHLPPKQYSVRQVELPPEYRKAYDAMQSQMLAELPDDGGELVAMTVLSKLTRLSQLASAAADVHTTVETVMEDGFPVEKVSQTVTLRAPSWKVNELLKVLEERPGYACVAFAPSKQLMRLAGEAAAAKGLRVGYVIGGQAAGERTATVHAFQARELDLLCATTGAGGTGLTLSAADALIFLQRPWSLVESLQAEDRGEGDPNAERGTEIIDIVARGTVDARVRQVLTERGGALAHLVQDPRIVAELLGGAAVRDLRRSA